MRYLKSENAEYGIMAITRGVMVGGVRYAETPSEPIPGWEPMTEDEVEKYFPPVEPIPTPPEPGPLLMDMMLKQYELEAKIDAIGIMLVPDIPEV